MIIDKAYLELNPEARLGDYDFSLKYSAKFNNYNANIKKRGNGIEISLSRKWENINEDVKTGLIQVLLNKIFKTKIRTQNIELYEIFLRKVHIAVPKTNVDPLLEESFEKVNKKYFNGIVEKPNLKWGSCSLTKLGSYEYGSDTITISEIFRNAEPELLDYIMYHEALHKKHKFYTKNGRSFHHTREFRNQEKMFEDHEQMERRVRQFVRGLRRKRKIWKWF